MGVRFRKSVQICKGVRVNFSKSGVSYTLGRKGASVSVGKNGTYLNTGIPGTGIYSRERIGGGRTEAQKNGSPPPAGQSSAEGITVVMDDRGQVNLQYGDGRAITDPALIRKIKATPQFKAEKQRLETLRREKINEILRKEEKSAEEFLNLHHHAPKVDTMQTFEKALRTLTPKTYQRKRFTVDAPAEADIRLDLQIEASQKISSLAFWKVNRLRAQYVDDNLSDRFALAFGEWEQKKAEFEAAEDAEEEKQNREYAAEYENLRFALEKTISGDSDFVSALIDSWISDCALPVEISVNYDYQAETGKLLVDIDLPEIEDIPPTEYVRLESGNIKEKKKPQAKLRKEYATLVFGLTLFIAANLFDLSPAIKEIILSGYTQRRDSDGNLNDDYIVSIRFPRKPFETEDVCSEEPTAFCMRFENRCNMTSTMLFKAIKPYQD